MAKYVMRGSVHYGTVDDMVNRILALEAELDEARRVMQALLDDRGPDYIRISCWNELRAFLSRPKP
jgi:hypothetical protein